jgi:hypothetical protein
MKYCSFQSTAALTESITRLFTDFQNQTIEKIQVGGKLTNIGKFYVNITRFSLLGNRSASSSPQPNSKQSIPQQVTYF